MTRGTGHIKFFAPPGIPGHGGRGGLIRKGVDIGDYVRNRGIIDQSCGHGRHLFAKNIVFVRAAGARFVVVQLALEVPGMLASQFRGVQYFIATPVRSMASAAHRIQGLAHIGISRCLDQGLGVGGVAVQPRLVRIRFIHHDSSAHGVMRHTTQLFAKHLECSGSGGCKPHVSDQTRHHIHLDPELRHGEVMQHVFGTEQHFDRFIYRQMYFLTRYQRRNAPHHTIPRKARRMSQS